MLNIEYYSDQKRKNLFNGDGIAYIRMRADKHEKIYATPSSIKQAIHLRLLADELEQMKNELKSLKGGE